MLPSVYGVVSQSVVGAVNWWQAGGATGAIAVYQPKGAASYAASLLDLSGNGNHAVEGVAPAWDAATGWAGNGSSAYLTTVTLPTPNCTLIIRFDNGLQTTTNALARVYLSGADSLLAGITLYHVPTSNSTLFSNGALLDNLATYPNLTEGVVGYAGKTAYRNGVSAGTIPTTSAPVGAHALHILASYTGGTVNLFTSARIQAFAAYDNALDAATYLAVSNAMALL